MAKSHTCVDGGATESRRPTRLAEVFVLVVLAAIMYWLGHDVTSIAGFLGLLVALKLLYPIADRVGIPDRTISFVLLPAVIVVSTVMLVQSPGDGLFYIVIIAVAVGLLADRLFRQNEGGPTTSLTEDQL